MPSRVLRDWTDSLPLDGISADAERLFIRLIMKADDYGRFHAEPRLVRAGCFPLSENLRTNDLTRWLDELSTRQLILRYETQGRRLLAIVNFNQRLRIARSKFPAPDGEPKEFLALVSNPRRVAADCGELPPDLDSDSDLDSDLDISAKPLPAGGEPSAPKVRKEPTGEHAEFAKRWTTEYPKHHGGEKYAFQGGKDGTAVKALLSTSKLTPGELEAIFVAAWGHPKGFHCKMAASICGFNSKFNEIREELRTLNLSAKSVTTFALTNSGPKGWRPPGT